MRPYILTRTKRALTISIRIDSSATIHVRAHPLIPRLLVESFIKKQESWIEAQLSKQIKKTAVETEGSILLFGKTYTKIITQDEINKTGFTILDQNLVYNNRLKLVTTTEATYIQAIGRFLKQTAEQYLLPRSHQLAKKMEVQFRHITLREQKSRWGSCSTTGTINFNWRLVHFAPQIIDYVIVHELAHITHHNHAPVFWARVAKYSPDYEQAKRALTKYAVPVG